MNDITIKYMLVKIIFTDFLNAFCSCAIQLVSSRQQYDAMWWKRLRFSPGRCTVSCGCRSATCQLRNSHVARASICTLSRPFVAPGPPPVPMSGTTRILRNLSGEEASLRRIRCSSILRMTRFHRIIGMTPPTLDSNGTPSRCRKRPTPSNSIVFKDHLKNLVYNTTLQDHQNMMRKRGLTLNIHQTLVLRLRYIAEYVIRSLNEFGWAVVDNFLGENHCRFTYKEIKCLYQRGLFSAGQLMDDKNKDEYHVKDIRSDQIYWFDGVDPRGSDAVTVRLLVSMIDSVVQHFKGRLPPYDISGRSRAMIAIYPGNGTRYVKHVDNPVKDGRCITAIYYCNEDWDNNLHGGTLRLYPETSAIPMDIDPKADRLVPRFAITMWYMDREERRKAIEQQLQKNGQAKVDQRVTESQVSTGLKSGAWVTDKEGETSGTPIYDPGVPTSGRDTPPSLFHDANEKMQMLPSASSEYSLTQLEACGRDVVVSSNEDKAASTDALNTLALNVSSHVSLLNSSSLHSVGDKDDTQYSKSVPPPDFQI
ncbi:hypothetical protein KIN20_033836 [Parelaphostrongylus tenuis]|uniref:Prolyl 4-hydroxylase alpha subunit domain-containing protein n=1 Tax=Parelaphostrongylus tenuis TaxID=148309 RepID=A0AAD5WJ70_PARTN|nr:hypothetical protein KIN20_033836 [Parelaphostrongylus tenuis]